MARKTKDQQLTHSQIANIRATHARRASQLMSRLGTYAAGETDKEGNPKVEMDANQVKAAMAVIGHILPNQTATTIEDLTPDAPLTKDQVQTMQRQAQKTLLDQIPADQLRALLEARESKQQ